MSQPVQLYHPHSGECLIVYHARLVRQLVTSGRWCTQPTAVPTDPSAPRRSGDSSVAATGLDPDVVQLLVLQGIRTKADIHRWTDAQLLRIRGVRAADVQVLRAWAA